MAMLVPRRNRSLFNELMADPFEPFFSMPPAHREPPTFMRADIKQTEAGFELVIDLPGIAKEDVGLELKEGMLCVKAQTKAEAEEGEGVTWLRKERFSGSCSRKFYVGEDIEEEQIKAHFENGTLVVIVPKKVEQPKLDEARAIAID